MHEHYDQRQSESKATEIPSLLSAALDFHNRGWTVFPVKGKIATVNWKGLQTRPVRIAELPRWFRGEKVTGVAVLHKDGLCCRDYDVAGAYDIWARHRPDLAGSLPTVRTARGYRVYFRNTATVYQKFEDGELIAGPGHYSILPPSRHRDGPLYTWHVPLGELTELDPVTAGLARCYTSVGSGGSDASAGVGQSRSQSDNDATQASHRAFSMPSAAGRGWTGQDVEQLIERTTPTGPGQRHNRIFWLAGGLRQLGVPFADCKPIVRAWYEKAEPFIRTQDFAENWGEFMEAYQNFDPTRFGLKEAMYRADRAEKLPVDQSYDTKVEGIARLCRELWILNGRQQFYLSTHSIKDLFDTNPTQASRWLKALQADGFIKQVVKGQFRGPRSKCGEYIWTYAA